MSVDASSHCDVLGCDLPAAHAYLHAVGTRLVEFSVCAGHMAHLERSGAPRVVTDVADPADDDRRIRLVLPPLHDLDDR